MSPSSSSDVKFRLRDAALALLALALLMHGAALLYLSPSERALLHVTKELVDAQRKRMQTTDELVKVLESRIQVKDSLISILLSEAEEVTACEIPAADPLESARWVRSTFGAPHGEPFFPSRL